MDVVDDDADADVGDNSFVISSADGGLPIDPSIRNDCFASLFLTEFVPDAAAPVPTLAPVPPLLPLPPMSLPSVEPLLDPEYVRSKQGTCPRDGWSETGILSAAAAGAGAVLPLLSVGQTRW